MFIFGDHFHYSHDLSVQYVWANCDTVKNWGVGHDNRQMLTVTMVTEYMPMPNVSRVNPLTLGVTRI